MNPISLSMSASTSTSSHIIPMMTAAVDSTIHNQNPESNSTGGTSSIPVDIHNSTSAVAYNNMDTNHQNMDVAVTDLLSMKSNMTADDTVTIDDKKNNTVDQQQTSVKNESSISPQTHTKNTNNSNNNSSNDNTNTRKRTVIQLYDEEDDGDDDDDLNDSNILDTESSSARTKHSRNDKNTVNLSMFSMNTWHTHRATKAMFYKVLLPAGIDSNTLRVKHIDNSVHIGVKKSQPHTSSNDGHDNADDSDDDPLIEHTTYATGRIDTDLRETARAYHMKLVNVIQSSSSTRLLTAHYMYGDNILVLVRSRTLSEEQRLHGNDDDSDSDSDMNEAADKSKKAASPRTTSSKKNESNYTCSHECGCYYKAGKKEVLLDGPKTQMSKGYFNTHRQRSVNHPNCTKSCPAHNYLSREY